MNSPDAKEPAHTHPPVDEAHETTRQAGRGALALSAAKALFIVLGLVQQFALFRVMGLSAYGALRSAQSPASITYNPIVTTGILGMSRVTSQAVAGGPVASFRAFAVHAVLGAAVALAFFTLSPWLASELGAPHIAGPLQLLATVILLYGLYAPLIGIFNGQRRFLHQAGLDMTAALLRTIGLVVGAWLCTRAGSTVSPVSGAVLGFIVSAVVVLGLALVLLGTRGRAQVSAVGGSTPIGQHMGFIGPVLIGQVVLNLLLQADLNTLRYFSSRAAAAAGLPVTEADALVGAYSTAQLFAFLPYQLMVGLGFVLFPMLAKADSENDRAAIGRYVQNGVRVSVMVTGLLVSVCAGLPHALIRFVFSGQAADLAAQSMRVLMVGLGAFAVFGALVTVLNGLKQQWYSMVITALAFAGVVTCNALMLQGEPFSPKLLYNTALSTSAALWLATLITAALVKRSAGAVVPLLTVLRVCIAVFLSATLAAQLPEGGRPLTLLWSAVTVVLYVGLLALLRELGKADLDGLRAIVARRKRG